MGLLRRVFGPRAHTGSVKDVTSRSPHEVDPREVGLTRRDVESIWRKVELYYITALHPAIQLCVRHRGEVIIDRAIGFARGADPRDGEGAERVPATPQTLFNLFSASKTITAMLIHLLAERGQVCLDAPVAEYFPEFAARGKRNITLRHVLSHRAGIPRTLPSHLNLDKLSSAAHIASVMSSTEPEAVPGRQLAYIAINGGFILAEVLRRVTGTDIKTFLQQEVLDPLGFEHLSYGVCESDLDKVALESFTGPLIEVPFGRHVRQTLGMGCQDAVKTANDPRFVTGVVPAGNVYATANEVSRYYELLLRGGELDGVRVFSPTTIARATRPEGEGFEIDRTILLPIRYSMGFMLGGRRLSFFGPKTQRAFGHLGFTNVLTYADPQRDMTVALMNNGNPLLTPEMLLWLNITRTIAATIPGKR